MRQAPPGSIPLSRMSPVGIHSICAVSGKAVTAGSGGTAAAGAGVAWSMASQPLQASARHARRPAARQPFGEQRIDHDHQVDDQCQHLQHRDALRQLPHLVGDENNGRRERQDSAQRRPSHNPAASVPSLVAYAVTATSTRYRLVMLTANSRCRSCTTPCRLVFTAPETALRISQGPREIRVQRGFIALDAWPDAVTLAPSRSSWWPTGLASVAAARSNRCDGCRVAA
jgi:hypothetical protein